MIAAVISVLAYHVYYKYDAIPPLTRRAWAMILALGAGCTALSMEGYTHRVLPGSGWQYWVVYGLINAPALIGLMFASDQIGSAIRVYRIEAVTRSRIRVDLVDDLLDILDTMGWHGQRVPWLGLNTALWIDRIAARVEVYLLPRRFIRHVRAADWLYQRRARWAEAFRHLEHQLASPVPGDWAKITKALEHAIRCLATGDLGTLAWRQPPAPQPRRRVLWQRTLAVCRAILVALLPLTAVLAAQPVIHVSTDVFRWTRIATGAWAVLYILLSLDPALSEKVEAARSVVGTVRDARSTGKTDSERTVPGLSSR